MSDASENPRVHLGANNPPADPEPKPDTFGAIKANIDDLFDEALNWLDGGAIETEAQAEAVQTLLRLLQEAHNAADDARILENEPFDTGKAEVQARYAPLIADTKKLTGKTVKAIAACKGALTVWLRKQEAARLAEAQRLRQAADAAATTARQATASARADNDLGAMEAAEETIAEARNADLAARRVENTPSKATGLGKAASLRDNWVATLTGPREALLHYLGTDPDSVRDWLAQRGEQDVRMGKRSIPGFTVENQRVAA